MPSRLTLACLATLAVATAAHAADPSFFLVNRGTTPLRELYVTPAGDANWGRNRLNGRVLAPGAQFDVRRRADGNCIMDIRAVYADGRREERRGVNTCTLDAVAMGEPSAGAAAGPGVAGKAPDDPSFRLVNRGSQPITALFATPAGLTNWGENRLEAGGLPGAAEKQVRIPRTGNCMFDLRVVFADGKALEKHRDNLCRITDLPVP